MLGPQSGLWSSPIPCIATEPSAPQRGPPTNRVARDCNNRAIVAETMLIPPILVRPAQRFVAAPKLGAPKH